MPDGKTISLWAVRLACLLYAGALAALIAGKWQAARSAWTAGCLLYLAHMITAFAFFHEWSHAQAHAATAKQTGDLFGIYWGGGLYFNYVFTAVWTGDAAWWLLHAASYRKRARWISAAVHAFLAFMFFNATVVFGKGVVRWAGVAATAGLAWLSARRREPRS
jgi:hypothetical protein